jgi:hypothetical protein
MEITTKNPLVINILFRIREPFTRMKLVNCLEKEKYEIINLVPIKAQFSQSQVFVDIDRVALKDGVEIRYNPDMAALGVAGANIENTITQFFELIKLLPNLDIAKNNVVLAELITNLNIKTNKDAYLSLSRNIPEFKTIKRITEMEPEISGIRFTPKDVQPISEDWYDLSINADFEDKKKYLLKLIYRHKGQDGLSDFLKKFNENIAKIIEEFESD